MEYIDGVTLLAFLKS
jgi:serine/threonine protein kinase